VRLQRIAPVQVRTHARHHAHASFLRRRYALAKEIAPVQIFPMTMKLHLRWIKREYARDANEDDIRLGTMPIIRPLVDVHHGGIVFRHVALADAANLLLPRLACRIQRRHTRWQRNQLGQSSA
jgi:hypothetical protein